MAEAGTVHYLSLEQMREAISSIGFTPRQRNVHYELFDEAYESKAVEANRLWMQEKQDASDGEVYQLA